MTNPSRRPRVDGVEPSHELYRHIMGFSLDPADHLSLEELFIDGRDEGDTTYAHLQEVARLKVIGVLRLAHVAYYFTDQGKYRRTHLEYVIPHTTDSLEWLVSYVADNMKGSRDFVRVTDLPEPYRSLTKHWRDTVRARARRMLLTLVIGELIDDHTQLWYLEGNGHWQAAQSLIDEYEPLLARVRGWSPPRREIKCDQRTFHGRPKRDRRRNGHLGIAPGVSTGHAQPAGRR